MTAPTSGEPEDVAECPDHCRPLPCVRCFWEGVEEADRRSMVSLLMYAGSTSKEAEDSVASMGATASGERPFKEIAEKIVDETYLIAKGDDQCLQERIEAAITQAVKEKEETIARLEHANRYQSDLLIEYSAKIEELERRIP